jgi:hypothetical protein
VKEDIDIKQIDQKSVQLSVRSLDQIAESVPAVIYARTENEGRLWDTSGHRGT